MSGYRGKNRQAANGGPSGIQRSYASQLKESEPLFNSYEHLQGLPRGDAALTMLRKVASLVKPIMRKRGWQVQILAEFLPPEQNLLGLNINHGYKICIRLRYHNNPDLFLPLEQVVDTMLHELSHIVWGDHDSNFHRLWDELRDEHDVLVRKGYTGEGFLSEGHRLGGSSHGIPPQHEMRRLARASAEKRKAQGTLGHGSGQRLGGTPLHRGADIRQVIADQVTRRNTVDRGCASGRSDAGKLSDQSANNTFKTKAEEDDANDRAIAQALFELMEQEEERKLQGTFSEAPPEGGLAWHPETGLYAAGKDHQTAPNANERPSHPTEEEQMRWAMQDSVVSPQSATNHSRPAFSPVSPLTPDHPSRTKSAPPLHQNNKPKAQIPEPGDSKATSKPLSRLVKDVDDDGAAAVAKRKRSATPASTSTPNAPALAAAPPTPVIDISEPHNPDQWTCQICTCINPLQFLACDACGVERPQQLTASSGLRHSRSLGAPSALRSVSSPSWTASTPAQPESLGWNCEGCGAFMEHKWWTCSACGMLKASS